MKKAVVVGASSGIGRALAKVLAANGYEVGLTARRVELLEQLQKEIPSKTFIKRMDISRPDEAIPLLEELIKEMNGLDLIVLNSGVNRQNKELAWEKESETIAVNVSGFAALAGVAVKHFLAQNSGHLAGISSIAALRGSISNPAYSASKAFDSIYLQGLGYKLREHNINVTDIRPGFVDTVMIREKPGLFWVATCEGAAEQILQAIRKKERVAYITRRWGIIAWLIKIVPDWVVYKCLKLVKRSG
jgi:short-subunit dehydrogenase